MLRIWRARLALKYIFFEMLPSFLLGVFIFVFILLMFQALRLTEFVLVHGVKWDVVLRMMIYLSVSFLPVILPMSLLFSILLTYGRLSNDSEIIALKSLGLNNSHLSIPAFILAGFTALVSAQTSFQIAPWGNRRFEVLINELGQLKASATIKAGVFSEGFFDLVVYANEVNSQDGKMKKIFIYDERNQKSPLTIIAKSGEMLQSSDVKGHQSRLRLHNGDIHKTQGATYTKIDFDSFDISLFDPIEFNEKTKTPLSYTLHDLNVALAGNTLDEKTRRILTSEFHKRWAIAVACFIFALTGVGMGIVTNKRNAKSGGIVLSIGLIVLYWILYIAFEGFARNQTLPVVLAVWMPNAIFGSIGLFSFIRSR